jgi:hypothetical protein
VPTGGPPHPASSVARESWQSWLAGWLHFCTWAAHGPRHGRGARERQTIKNSQTRRPEHGIDRMTGLLVFLPRCE